MTEKGVYCFLALLFGITASYFIIKNIQLRYENDYLQQVIEEGHYCVSTCVEMLETMGC